MPEAAARIVTDRADRYIGQLCEHLGHLGRMAALHKGMPRMLDVEHGESGTFVRFDQGIWLLEAAPEELVVRVRAEDAERLERLKSALASRLATIGRRDGLAVEWADQPAGS
jgi:hypothetical protein